jgi:phosphomannomutase
MNADALTIRAERWADDDPDPLAREELHGVLEACAAGVEGAAADLADRFTGLLQFGTAGLRGRLGAGPHRMNRAVVRRAAWALAQHLTEKLRLAGDTDAATVVIGYDARHGSRDFAYDTAAVMSAAGHRALVLPGQKPTPVLAYATRALRADAGVMVTASHNPAWDNGYKVYLGERITPEAPGAQLVSPHDVEIAARMAAIRSASEIPFATDGWEELDHAIVDQYVAKAAAVVRPLNATLADQRANISIVLTPIHGVGDQTVRAALHRAGFTDLTSVPEQAEPDPDFPTVAFPNPEEPGAMDLALKLAMDKAADVVIANDPDTDRCAVATVIDGHWMMLHGDVVGSLLGDRIAAHRSLLRIAPGMQTLANSVVSSQQLGAIAAKYNLAHAHTLTGFKWIARAPHLVYGYEEALGYCVAPDVVLDKDGITAAVMIADLVATLKAEGRTLQDAIDDLAHEHGVYLTRQVSARFDDLSVLTFTMAALLATPPTALGGAPVTQANDMSGGFQGLPGTTGLHLATATGARVIVRPSGTEPKVKAYLEVTEPVQAGDVRGARARAESAMSGLEADVRAALGV